MATTIVERMQSPVQLVIPGIPPSSTTPPRSLEEEPPRVVTNPGQLVLRLESQTKPTQNRSKLNVSIVHQGLTIQRRMVKSGPTRY